MNNNTIEDIDQIYGELPQSWQLAKLEELLQSKRADLQTGPFGTMLHASSYKEQGIPVLAVQHIGDNRINHDPDIPKVDQETFGRLARYEIKKNDIIFCRKGAVERVALVTDEENGWLQGSDCIRLRLTDISTLDPIFFSYVFCSRAYKRWITRHAHGATMPSLNQAILRLSPIPLPSIEEQREATKILSLFDRKISNLRKQNETLEQIAQTLFKHWFVDFEFPNSDGKPYKSSGGAMEPSELGEIPANWRVGKLDDEVETLGGGTPSTKEPDYWVNGYIPWYSPTDLTKSNTLFSLGSEKRITRLGLENSSAKLFPAYSLLLTSRATIGEITINTQPACTNQGFITLVPNESFSVYFLYGWLLTQINLIKQLASGSTFPELTKSNFRMFLFLIPEAKQLVEYDQMIKPVFQKVENNISQIETLTRTRDVLLPKLMSGKLRITADESQL